MWEKEWRARCIKPQNLLVKRLLIFGVGGVIWLISLAMKTGKAQSEWGIFGLLELKGIAKGDDGIADS